MGTLWLKMIMGKNRGIFMNLYLPDQGFNEHRWYLFVNKNQIQFLIKLLV